MAEAPAKSSPSSKPASPAMQRLLVAGCLLAIAASAVWIYHYQFGSSGLNGALQQSVGQVLAEETVRVVGKAGRIVVVTAEPAGAPELKAQLNAFQKNLKLLGGITVQDKVVLDPGDNPKYRPGAGLSAKHFLKIARKHAGADAIVSFVGAPALSEQDLAQMKAPVKLIAETHSPEKLVTLLDKKILVSAVVPRFEFPAPGPRKPTTSRQWFDRYFQVLTPDSHLAAADEAP